MSKKNQKAVCTINVTFKLSEVTGKMFLRQTVASGSIEDTYFTLDRVIPGGHQIITIGERVFLLTTEEVVSKLYTATRHVTPPAPTVVCWNSVEDSLPDENYAVIVFADGIWFEAWRFGEKWIIRDKTELVPRVTHWADPVPPTSSLQPKAAALGRCPVCGALGVTRERRPGGNDTCKNGHLYLSTSSLQPQASGLNQP